MPEANQEQLHKRLIELIKSASSSVQAELGSEGEVVIARRGHVRGVWRCTGDQCAWTPAGYGEPTHTTRGIEDAVTYTQTVLLPR